jgi:ComF family protein
MATHPTLSIYDRARRIRAWLLPAACPLCGESIAPERDFCDGCERALPMVYACCTRCAAALEQADTSALICGQCQQNPPAYTTVRAPFRYAGPIDRLILGAKYGARLDWVALLSRAMTRHIDGRANSVDAVVPVPLHRSRLRERGYNQSLELARPLAKQLGLPLMLGVERVRATPPQTSLSRADRRKNVRRAFAANGDFAGLRIAVVDDVLTSGATAEAMAQCLLKAGATSVEVWVAARA